MPLRLFQQYRRLGLGVLIILIIFGGITLRIWHHAAPDVLTPVTVQEPLRLTRTVLLHPAHTQTVTSTVSGRVEGAVPTPGAFVREGDVLVTVLALTAPPAAAPVPPAATRDTTQADAWLAAGIITRAEHDRLVGASTTPAARAATPAAAPVAYPLTAPMTGRIGQVYIEPDGSLIAGMPALTVQATDTLTAALVIPPALAPLLRDPLAVRTSVTLDTNGMHHGELAAVDTSDPAAVIAKLRFANPDDTLPVETEVPVTLTGDATMTVTHLPRSARSGDHSLTVVDASGIIDRRTVVTAYTTATDWVILDGLRPGDRVITHPSDRWQPGMKVEV